MSTAGISKCVACDGRGYHRCDCWPGDCICGFGDTDCEECGGEGLIDTNDDDIDVLAAASPSPSELRAQCEAFNKKYPVGQMVSVRKDAGDGVITTTRSKAEVLSGHSAVIWLEGITGCYLLNRVTPIVSPTGGNHG